MASLTDSSDWIVIKRPSLSWPTGLSVWTPAATTWDLKSSSVTMPFSRQSPPSSPLKTPSLSSSSAGSIKSTEETTFSVIRRAASWIDTVISTIRGKRLINFRTRVVIMSFSRRLSSIVLFKREPESSTKSAKLSLSHRRSKIVLGIW